MKRLFIASSFVVACCLAISACFLSPLDTEWLPCDKQNQCSLASKYRCYYVQSLNGNYCLANGEGYPLAGQDGGSNPDPQGESPAPDTKPEAQPEPQNDTKPEAQPEPQPEPEPQSEAQPEPQPEPEPQSEAQAEPQPEPEPQNESSTETNPEASSE